MKIKFKDGHEIEFEQSGKILLAESVIWEGTELHGSMDELRELKTKITGWFAENAPDEIREKYNARLPLQEEIQPLSFAEQLAYKEGKTDETADYFIGDEDCAYPARCSVGTSLDEYSWVYFYATRDWSGAGAIRLCLEERK